MVCCVLMFWIALGGHDIVNRCLLVSYVLWRLIDPRGSCIVDLELWAVMTCSSAACLFVLFFGA